MNSASEQAVAFECAGSRLFAILHEPKRPYFRGVLVVVGGPQYRVGSHRQFVLLARALARAGICVMRFDYRGMGDSEGERRTFEDISADIRAAIDAFLDKVESLREVVIWGLCDAASAALFYGYNDRRVTGLVLVNPWARAEDTIARAYIKHYYLSRLFSRSLWQKIASGEFKVSESAASLVRLAKAALQVGSQKRGGESDSGTAVPKAPLENRMADGLDGFQGHVLFVLSGDDMTAAEFRDTVSASRRWRRLLRDTRVSLLELPGANHTFSRSEWRDQVSDWTAEWVQSW